MNTQQYTKVNKVGPHQLINGTRDITEKDLAQHQLNQLKSAASLQEMNPQITEEDKREIKKMITAFGIAGICFIVFCGIIIAGTLFFHTK